MLGSAAFYLVPEILVPVLVSSSTVVVVAIVVVVVIVVVVAVVAMMDGWIWMLGKCCLVFLTCF